MTFPVHTLLRKDLVWTTEDAPEVLYAQGSTQALSLLKLLPERGLAIVGTRNPQPRSVDLVRKTLQNLTQSELIIISGMARGIDAAAHWAAVESNLPTIAILGAGLDLPYPKENSQLRKKILENNGLIISEYPLGTPALSHHFLRRNRIIAALALATWVVEASFRSGALNTARWAREYDRSCYAVPCFPEDPALLGNQTLLDRDHALAFWGAHSFGATWISLATSHPSKKQSRHSDPELVKYVKMLTLQKGGAPVDEVFNWTRSQNWTTEEFYAALRSAMDEKTIFDHQGVLISNQS